MHALRTRQAKTRSAKLVAKSPSPLLICVMCIPRLRSITKSWKCKPLGKIWYKCLESDSNERNILPENTHSSANACSTSASSGLMVLKVLKSLNNCHNRPGTLWAELPAASVWKGLWCLQWDKHGKLRKNVIEQQYQSTIWVCSLLCYGLNWLMICCAVKDIARAARDQKSKHFEEIMA